MKKIIITVYSAILIILIANFFYYKSLYNKQINYIVELLDRQVQIVGLSVDTINNLFSNDLNQICYSEDLSLFFANDENQFRAKEKFKVFFSKYQDFITGIKLYDNNKNEFTLKKDFESDDWLESIFTINVQPTIYNMEKLALENRKYNYYQTVVSRDNNDVIGNLVLSVDYEKYFSFLFSKFNLKDYQWQWVVGDNGVIVYDNFEGKIEYSQLDRIAQGLANGSVENIIHNASIEGERREILSSYYSSQLLTRNLGLVFSAPTAFFQKYIIRNSLFIVLATLLLIQIIIYILWKFIRSQKSELDKLRSSEKMLFKLIEEMPVGVIIHNRNREILKANKVAATLYSYMNEEEMRGKIFPEPSFSEGHDYFSRNLSSTFNPDQFLIIKKEVGEIVLYRSSMPVIFTGEESTMEILIDITMLESARKQEVKANVAKSEFLARMSYEIRTPLNGIIGMTDVLKKQHLSDEVRDIINLLHRSTEVLLNIVTDILDFSKIESGKMILDEVPFNIRDEIQYCVDIAKTNIQGNMLRIISSVDDKVPESIIGDPFRMRQVMMNLLNNSIKNTEKGEIHLKCLLKNNKEGEISLGFEFLDTGRSFDHATLKRIFDDSGNIESKTSSNNEAPDFGTIVSKQLVNLMGGELTAVSPSGLEGDKGTKVSFTIDTYSNDRPVKKLSLESINSFEKIKTLVITGNKNRDEEILSALHTLGLNITITTFLKSTINQIKANMDYPDEKYNMVIIFDDEHFDGFDVARIIWENNLSASFIILMIGANDKKGNYMKCFTFGIDHYFIKPFDFSDLLNKLENSFPFIEDTSSSHDIGNVRSDINILVVEDNIMNQKVIGTLLKNLGYNFDIANDGYSGYLQAKTRKYDLIFMDLIMPEMDGYESAQKILEYDKSILIVAFTADNMPESRRKAELAGIRDFISKPVRMEELKNLFAKYFKM